MLEMDPTATYRIMVDSRGRKLIVKEIPIPASGTSAEIGSNSRPEEEDYDHSGVISFGTTGDALDIEEKVIDRLCNCGNLALDLAFVMKFYLESHTFTILGFQNEVFNGAPH